VTKLHNRKGGFTLIELMIVVAIIGILAAIAIPNFLRFQLKAKTSEGKTNIAAIRTAEESYYSEFGVYVSANASPANPGLNTKQPFNNVDGVGNGFDRLGWAPEGQIFFNYGVATNAANFTASSAADIDANGAFQGWGYRKGGAAVTAKTLGTGGQCPVANLVIEVVSPCNTADGQSVF
jgi:type IV pilus assembly protein PilA